MSSHTAGRAIALVLALLSVAACGASSTPKVAAVTPSAQASEPPGTVPASGDIPDNVVWLTYSGSGFSIQYPEGWVSNVTSAGATFSDKDSHIAIVLSSGPAPTKQSVTNEIAAISGAKVVAAAHAVALPTGNAIKVSYDVNGPVNPVTGKQPRLNVDRYEITSAGKVAVLDLAAQVGIDNVDAYLAIAKSFKWAA
jgi:hypothetical protein